MNLDYALVLSVLSITCFWSALDFFLAKSMWSKIMEAFWFLTCAILSYILCLSYSYGRDLLHFSTWEYVIYIIIYATMCFCLLWRSFKD